MADVKAIKGPDGPGHFYASAVDGIVAKTINGVYGVEVAFKSGAVLFYPTVGDKERVKVFVNRTIPRPKTPSPEDVLE